MRKILILLVVALLLFSGCVDKKTGNKIGNNLSVKIGDNVSVDYTGSKNGNIFDTSIESIAKENNLSVPNRIYKPLRFTVGKGQVMKGFDEGIIGMKLGESKTLTIPPEKAYGLKDPQLIQTFPVIQNMSATRTFPKIVEVPIGQFDPVFGTNHKIGDNVKIPNSDVNLTIKNMTTVSVSLSYNLKVGDEISKLTPWNETVIKVDDKNITTKSEAKKNDTVQLQGAVWNTTVIDVNSGNITLKHISIPDTKIRIPLGKMMGSARIHFNDTYITMDANNELAGETLIFNITVKSIGPTTPP